MNKFYGVGLGLLMMCASASSDVADQVRSTGVKGGLVVHLGCGDGMETVKARLDERYIVQGLEDDHGKVVEARKNILAAGVYGAVTVYRHDGKELPYVDNLVNVIVGESLGGIPQAEVMRVLAPGGVALIGGKRIVKTWPAEIDEWTHYLHNPANNAVGRDRVAFKPRALQWVAVPQHSRSHEEMASMSAAVTAKGRMFYIADYAPRAYIRFDGQWRLTARDAFNGVLLWERKIAKWSDHLRHFRAGPLHLPRRLVAVGDHVYVTLGLDAPVSQLDAATGKTLKVYAGTERTEEILVEGGVLYLVVGTSEVKREGDGLHARGEPEATDFRFITALDIESGATLWKHEAPDEAYILPVSLTVRGGSVFYQSTLGVTRLAASRGELLWTTPRETPLKRRSFSSPTVVATDEVLLVADRGLKKTTVARDLVEWGVSGWDVKGYPRKSDVSLSAYEVKDGRELWKADCSEGYNSPVDLFVVGNEVWVGQNYKCYDLKTGQETKQINWKGPGVGMSHPRCYRNKATEQYIYTCRSGIEVVSLEKGCVGNNSWIRGACQYGILPANGLLYAPPHACACFSRVKLTGFCAVAHHRKEASMESSKHPVLERGPAYGKVFGKVSAEDWPMYRHDSRRSGVTGAKAPSGLGVKWSAKLGGKLSQPIVACGRVYVASIDAHTLHALDEQSGRELWSFTAGGRIDSAPSVFEGYVLFGCADGWIYSLDGADGRMAWRFRAAPQERQSGVYDQLESVWPVHGAVQLQNGILYACAGRNSYLDGGMVLYGLDPASGKELFHTPLYDIDPETDVQTAKEARFEMSGVKTDMITGDGENVYIKHMGFDRNGKKVDGVPHLMSAAGLLDREWYVRSYWLIGTTVGGGWGSWAREGASLPTGRILCHDGEKTWGYGRVEIKSAAAGHKLDAYHLFCKSGELPSGEPEVEKGKKRGNVLKLEWSQKDSLTVRAMVKAGERLVVAGPPNLGKRDSEVLQFLNEPEALAGFMGKKGVTLRLISAADGRKVSETDLDAMPVFDGMSAANGNLYLSLKNGVVECRGE